MTSSAQSSAPTEPASRRRSRFGHWLVMLVVAATAIAALCWVAERALGRIKPFPKDQIGRYGESSRVLARDG